MAPCPCIALQRVAAYAQREIVSLRTLLQFLGLLFVLAVAAAAAVAGFVSFVVQARLIVGSVGAAVPVVVGSSSLIHNAMYLQAAGNGNLFLNTIAWFVGEAAQIGNRADENEVAKIEMNTYQGLLISIFCILIAPGIFLLGARHTWRQRREK